jgi:hypothetical protein
MLISCVSVDDADDGTDSGFKSASSSSLTPPVQKIYLSIYYTYNVQKAIFYWVLEQNLDKTN